MKELRVVPVRRFGLNDKWGCGRNLGRILVKKLRDEDPLDFAQGLRGAGFFLRPAGSVEDQARIACLSVASLG